MTEGAGAHLALDTVLVVLGVIGTLGLLFMSLRRSRLPRAADHAEAAVGALELHAKLAQGEFAVLDVRNPDEFVGPLGHVASAINVPLAGLPAYLDTLDRYRRTNLAVVCLSEQRSRQAIRVLRTAGFEQLFLLRGGMKEWSAQQLPVARCTPERVAGSPTTIP
jgi:rhodanese-related sulfurtransferase